VTDVPATFEGGPEQQLRAMNEALLVSSVRMHELADKAQQAEAGLRESETRFRRLFQSSRDGILILDIVSGRVIDANASLAGLLGREIRDLVGKQLWEIGVLADTQANRSVLERLRAHGYVRCERLALTDAQGRCVDVEFIGSVHTEGARLVAQCNIRDISVRVALEQKVKQQAETLADQSRHKDEFLAMLSHELRNPLAPIRSATHLLRLQERSGPVNPIQQQAREVIERQVTTLTRLVSDLMEVSRALTGRIRLNIETVDLNQLLRHAVETAGPVIEKRRHTLTAHHCPEELWIQADATRIGEVLVNLLVNAAKYTQEGGRIEVSCERDGSHALVVVRDNGAGIDPALLPRIFDLFSQGDRTLDRAQGGLGIGLSLAYRIVQLHGGSIEVQSEGPGKGSQFTVRLALAPAPGATPPAGEAALPSTPDSLRVLVVDDNVDACLMLANLVALHGHAVMTAYTGPAALARAREWSPHVLLLDIGLPQIDGYEVARRLRADPATRGVKLIAVTGYGADKDIELGREAGFDAHLVKPVDVADIERLLSAWKPAAAS
jgi:PAS domain S-box-containing protein